VRPGAQIWAEHAAFAECSARFHVTALGIWEDQALDARSIGWARDLHAAMAATGAGGTYVNCGSPDELYTDTTTAETS
jgi:hypothetical protein